MFLWAKDSKGYVEIEITAKRAQVMIAWIIDTFETSSGRSLTDVKDKLLSISGVTITR